MRKLDIGQIDKRCFSTIVCFVVLYIYIYVYVRSCAHVCVCVMHGGPIKLFLVPASVTKAVVSVILNGPLPYV